MSDEIAIMPLGTDSYDDVYNAIINSYYNDRMLIINQGIDSDLLEYISMSIIRWNMEDKDIPVDKRRRGKILVNTDGGDIYTGLQIISSIKSSITPIDTIGFSKCMSMGSYILAAGDKRYCFENTVVLIHDGSVGYYATGNKGRDIQEFYGRLCDRLRNFLLERTTMSEEFLDEKKDREYYMFADEAKDNGIVDYIINVDCQLDDVFN